MGRKKRKKQDGTGPYKESFMFSTGRRGKKKARQRGSCL